MSETTVMNGLDPVIHAAGQVRSWSNWRGFGFIVKRRGGGIAWMAGSSPAMTVAGGART